MSWSGAVALVLATAVGIAWAVAVIVHALNPGTITVGGSFALYGLGGTLVGGVVGWLLRSAKKRGDDDDEAGPGGA